MRKFRHFAVGMKANGSKISRIAKPTTTDAYTLQWYGKYRFQNPKWYDVFLADGRVIRDTEVQVEL